MSRRSHDIEQIIGPTLDKIYRIGSGLQPLEPAERALLISDIAVLDRLASTKCERPDHDACRRLIDRLKKSL